MYSLRHLMYFVAVAKHGSIAEAARREVVSTTSIIAALDVLETRLKKKLFHRRRSKGLSLTPDGLEFLRIAEDFLATAEQFEIKAFELTARQPVELSVGVFDPLSARLLPNVIQDLVRDFPDLLCNIFTGTLETLSEMLRTGTIRAAIHYDIMHAPPQFTHVPLAQARLAALLPQNHPLAREKQLHLAQLADEPMIQSSYAKYEILTGVFEVYDFRPMRQHTCQSFETMSEMIRRGLGYTIVLAHSFKKQRSYWRDLVPVPIVETLPRTQIVATVSISDETSDPDSLMGKFLQVCKRHISDD